MSELMLLANKKLNNVIKKLIELQEQGKDYEMQKPYKVEYCKCEEKEPKENIFKTFFTSIIGFFSVAIPITFIVLAVVFILKLAEMVGYKNCKNDVIERFCEIEQPYDFCEKNVSWDIKKSEGTK